MNKIEFFTGTSLHKVSQEINAWCYRNHYSLVNASAERNPEDGVLVTVIYNTLT